MRIINIPASNFAKITGHNKYESIEKTIQTVLNSNKIKKFDLPKTNIEEELKKLNTIDLLKIKKELNLPETCNISDIENTIQKSIMNRSYNKDINEDKSRSLVDQKLEGKDILKNIETSIKKDLMIKRGNIRENQNLNLLQQKNNIKINNRNSKLYSKPLLINEEKNYTVILRGKIDGLSDEVIIETKNRTKGLFYKLREYEQVQLEVYMFLTGIHQAILTENYNDQSNEINYSHNENFWNQCILNTQQFMDQYIVPHFESI